MPCNTIVEASQSNLTAEAPLGIPWVSLCHDERIKKRVLFLMWFRFMTILLSVRKETKRVSGDENNE